MHETQWNQAWSGIIYELAWALVRTTKCRMENTQVCVCSCVGVWNRASSKLPACHSERFFREVRVLVSVAYEGVIPAILRAADF